MNQQSKRLSPIGKAAMGITALVLIAVFANLISASLPIGSRGIDFTENQIHTLTEGTAAILSELDAPVTIRYYATRDSETLPRELKLYMRRVDDLLKEYQSRSNGKLRIEYLDPQPDTDAEDAAVLDGISGQRISEQDNFFFGLAVACLDQTSSIPFIDPNEETMLEYEISRAIAEVAAPRKPVLGLISALPMAGGMPMAPGQQPTQEWVIYQQLAQNYEIREIELTSEDPIDPGEISALLVIHPADLPETTEFAIDQYLLQGGTLIACLDAFSITAQRSNPAPNPMMGMPPQGGIDPSSTLPNLLKAWGLKFESEQVIADPKYRTRLSNNQIGDALLNLPAEAMPDKDNLITRDLTDLYFILPGGFSIQNKQDQLTYTTLVQTSANAQAVDATRASNLDPRLLSSAIGSGRQYDLAMHVAGNFTTAFPKGNPADADQEDEDKDEQANDAPPAETSADAAATDDDSTNIDITEDQNSAPTPSSNQALKASTKPGNVFLIADVDFIADDFSFRVQNFGGMQLASAFNGNPSLFQNLIDQAAGSKHLIGSRSRSSNRRPFTVMQDMETAFEKEVGAKIREFEASRQTAMEKLRNLESQKQSGSEMFLSPEQEAEIKKLRDQQVSYSRRIRDIEKDLKRRKDALAAKITWLNVGVIPALVVVFGLFMFIRRRIATNAR